MRTRLRGDQARRARIHNRGNSSVNNDSENETPTRTPVMRPLTMVRSRPWSCVQGDKLMEFVLRGVYLRGPMGEDKPTRRSLSRAEVAEQLQAARAAGRCPNLSGRRMSGEDYSGLDFTSEFQSKAGPFTSEILGADFRNAGLRGCNFNRSDLAMAWLRGADLTGADLMGANLYTALLESANLQNANLREANLQSAELQGVRVTGADFAGARFGHTSIGDVDFSGAVNLDLAVHRRPSSISSQTLHLTAAGLANMPQATRGAVFRFLANSGVDEELLTIVRSWIGKPIEFYSVFLSHSSLDKLFARKLYADLRSVGVDCWFDENQILPGDNILDFVDQGIRIWDKLILVCSESSLPVRTGWWVEQEIERALAKERQLRSTGARSSVLVPITLDDYIFNQWGSRFKASVIDKHVGDFRAWQEPREYCAAFDQLLSALDVSRRTLALDFGANPAAR